MCVQTYLKLSLKIIIKLKIWSYLLLFACQSGLKKKRMIPNSADDMTGLYFGFTLSTLLKYMSGSLWKYTGKALMYIDFFPLQFIITFLYFYLSFLFFHLFPFLPFLLLFLQELRSLLIHFLPVFFSFRYLCSLSSSGHYCTKTVSISKPWIET